MQKEIAWLLKEKYQGQKSPAFLADCERLKAGEPLGYVIGWVPFLDCQIWLDSHPLIPRPETEYWTEHVIDTLRTTPSDRPKRILDLCAGSGCSGVAIAHAIPNTHVDFAELDALHLPTILRNLTEDGVDPERCTILQSDCFNAVTETYDCIISNPPYIDPALDRAEASVKLYEPHLALYGGTAGIEIIEQIITEAPAKLVPHGQLWLEHEPEQSAAIQQLGSEQAFAVTTHVDQYDVERYSVLVLQ